MPAIVATPPLLATPELTPARPASDGGTAFAPVLQALLGTGAATPDGSGLPIRGTALPAEAIAATPGQDGGPPPPAEQTPPVALTVATAEPADTIGVGRAPARVATDRASWRDRGAASAITLPTNDDREANTAPAKGDAVKDPMPSDGTPITPQPAVVQAPAAPAMNPGDPPIHAVPAGDHPTEREGARGGGGASLAAPAAAPVRGPDADRAGIDRLPATAPDPAREPAVDAAATAASSAPRATGEGSTAGARAVVAARDPAPVTPPPVGAAVRAVADQLAPLARQGSPAAATIPSGIVGRRADTLLPLPRVSTTPRVVSRTPAARTAPAPNLTTLPIVAAPPPAPAAPPASADQIPSEPAPSPAAPPAMRPPADAATLTPAPLAAAAPAAAGAAPPTPVMPPQPALSGKPALVSTATTVADASTGQASRSAPGRAAAAASPSSPAPAQAAPTILPALHAFGAALHRAAAAERQTVPAPEAVAALIAPAPAPATASATVAAPLDTTHHRWPEAMVARIEQLRDAADAQDTRIRLHPDALGTIDVALRRDGDAVHVRFTAAEPATRALLAEAQPRLTELADARGLKLAGGGADTQAGGGGQGAGDRRPPLPPRPPRAAAPVADPIATDDRIA